MQRIVFRLQEQKCRPKHVCIFYLRKMTEIGIFQLYTILIAKTSIYYVCE